MEWIDLKQKKPKQKGPYLVSISRPYHSGDFVFNYVAFYNNDNDTWHKYNPFEDKSVGEFITFKVIGWVEDLSSYLGMTKY